jgi:hypothetical protein
MEKEHYDILKNNVKKILIATPAYDGTLKSNYVNGAIETASMFTSYGIPFGFYILPNESLIPRARNYCADILMRDDNFSHMIFIDSDIGFHPSDILTTLYHSIIMGDLNIMCVSYPKKAIAWEKVVKVVNSGAIDGKNPSLLETIAADFVLNFKGTTQTFKTNEPIEVMETGTGFMLFSKNVLKKISNDNPNIFYKPDHSRTTDFNGSREIGLYFHCEVESKSKRYLSEDYYFCRLADKSGIKTYVIPWINLTHMGTAIFKGNMLAMLDLGLDLTHGSKFSKKKGDDNETK